MSPYDGRLPNELIRDLGRLQRQVRNLAVARGLGLVALVTSAALAVGMLVDLQWELGVGVRAGLLGMVGVLTLVTVWKSVIRPALQPFTSAELAAVVENAYPELKERLTSTIELNDPSIPEAHKGSPFMRELLTKQTLQQVAPLRFTSAVSPAQSVRMTSVGLVAVVVLLFPFVIASDGYGLLWARFFSPWGNFDRAGNLAFEIENGDRVVARGTDVPIQAKLRWRGDADEMPETVWLNWTDSAGDSDSRQMLFDADAEFFTTTVPHVFNGFKYDVSARDSRSRRYQIEVVEAPALTAATLDIEPPAYLRRPAKNFDGVVGEIPVFERSRLRFQLKFNKPIASAEIEWLAPVPIASATTEFKTDYDKPLDGAEAVAANDSSDSAKSGSDDVSRVKLQLSADRTSATLDIGAVIGGPFVIRLTDEHGLTNGPEPNRNLVITMDQPPTLELGNNDSQQEARPSDKFPVTVSATDDIRIAALELHYEIFQSEKGSVAADAKAVGIDTVDHTFQLDLAAIGAKDGDVITYRIRAADERPIPEPNEVWSERHFLTVSRNAKPPGSSEVAARQREMRERLQAIRKDVGKNRTQVAALQQVAESDLRMQLKFDKGDQIKPLSREQMELAQRLEDLSAVFEQHPLYGNLTEDAQHVARRDLPESSQQMSKSVDAELRDKVTAFTETEQRLAAAENTLLDLEKQFDELAEIENDLLELGRLAQQVKQLADDTLALEEKRNETQRNQPKPGETQEQTQQRQEEMAQEQQRLVQQQQNLMDQLDDLLERRPELVDAARRDQLDRLADLSQQALDIAEPQDLLAQALSAGAVKASKQIEPLAKEQSELLDAVEELAAQAEAAASETNGAPVATLDLAQLRQLVEDLKKGNLQDAAVTQKAVAEDLERFANELDKNRQLPADPQQAVQELAKRQAALQNKVAEAAKQATDQNLSDKQQQAFQRQMRQLAAEQAAVQMGLARLELPEKNREQQQQSVNQAAESVQQLLASDPQQAQKSAEQAATAAEQAAAETEQLAQQIGSKEQRIAGAIEQLEQLRQEQAALGKKVTAAQQDKQATEQATAQQLQKLAGEQTDLARQLAKLDAPDADREHRDAVQKAAAALTDLERGRTQDAKASQQQAEQALARLEKKLAGEPVPEETVSELQQQQDAISKQSEAALAKSDQAELQQQAKQQQQIAEQLAKLDAPAARPQQQAAREAAQSAAEQLAKAADAKGDPEKLDQALDNADAALERLAKAVQPPQSNPIEQAEQLAKRQQEAAKSAQQVANDKQVPSAESRQQASNELAQLTDAAERLRAGDTAQAEKRDALEELQKATQAQKQLNQQAAKAEADNPSANDKPSEAMQQQLANQAQAQQNAADALERLEKKLSGETPPNQPNRDEQQVAEKVNELTDSPKQSPRQVAEAAAQLANEQAELRQQTEQLDGDQTREQLAEAAKPLAANQEQLQRRAEQLPTDTAALPRAEAMQQLQQAAESLKQGNVTQAAQAQQQAEQALRQVQQQAEALAQAESSPTPNAGEPTANQAAAEQAAQLADQQRQLQQQLAQARQERGQSPAGSEPNQNGDPTANSTQPNGQAQPQEQGPPNAAQAQAMQRQLTQETAELALNAARQLGAESEAAQAAAESARMSGESSRQAQAGQLQQAGDAAQQAAESAQQAAQQLASAAKGNPNNGQNSPQSQLAQQAESLAQRQSQMAEQFQQLAQSPAQRNLAQQQGQQQLAAAAQQLAQDLADAAQRLTAEPLSLQQQGQQAGQAQQSAQQAQQAMQQAAQQLQQSDTGNAAQAAAAAAEAIRNAANQASGTVAESTPPDSPIPNNIGAQVTEAAQQLQQAQQQLAQANQQLEQNNQQPGQQPGQQSGQPSQQSGQPNSQTAQNGQQSGQPNQQPGQNGQPSSQPGQQSGQSNSSQQANGQNGQPSQNNSGQQSASPLAQSAKSLQKAAQSLAQAAQQLQPGGKQSPNGQQQSGAQSQSQALASQQSSPGSSEGSAGTGATATVDLSNLENELKKLAGRNWGQLPGHMRTEILQASRRKPNGDYAKLIKRYFQEIAKTRNRSQSSNPKRN